MADTWLGNPGKPCCGGHQCFAYLCGNKAYCNTPVEAIGYAIPAMYGFPAVDIGFLPECGYLVLLGTVSYGPAVWTIYLARGRRRQLDLRHRPRLARPDPRQLPLDLRRAPGRHDFTTPPDIPSTVLLENPARLCCAPTTILRKTPTLSWTNTHVR